MGGPFRIEPAGKPGDYVTYGAAQPLSSHWRVGTCGEVACPHQEHGWRSIIDERTELGSRQAFYIRRESGRRYTCEWDEAGLTVFTFEPGQVCFGEHRVPLERPAIFTVRGGDHRGNPRRISPRVFTTAEQWRDDFGEHQQKLVDRLNRG